MAIQQWIWDEGRGGFRGVRLRGGQLFWFDTRQGRPQTQPMDEFLEDGPALPDIPEETLAALRAAVEAIAGTSTRGS